MAIDPPRPAPAVLVLALVLLGALGPARLAAATLTVTDCGDSGAPGQLRTLINAAAPGDTILVPACMVTLTGALGDDANVSGDLDVLKSLTIQGVGPGLTVIDGGGTDRVFDVPVGVTVTLSDLTIQNGFNGVRNAGNVTLQRVTIQGNWANFSRGGGILNTGSLTGTDLTIRRNFAQDGGACTTRAVAPSR